MPQGVVVDGSNYPLAQSDMVLEGMGLLAVGVVIVVVITAATRSSLVWRTFSLFVLGHQNQLLQIFSYQGHDVREIRNRSVDLVGRKRPTTERICGMLIR